MVHVLQWAHAYSTNGTGTLDKFPNELHMYMTPLDTKCINIKSSDSEFDLLAICFVTMNAFILLRLIRTVEQFISGKCLIGSQCH